MSEPADWAEQQVKIFEETKQSLPGKVLLKCFVGKTEWTRTAAELYDLLFPHVIAAGDDKYFPANTQSLSNALRRPSPSLPHHGVDFGISKKKHKVAGKSVRLLTIRRSCRVTKE